MERNAATRIAIPQTALRVSRLCLGGVPLGTALGPDQSFALLDAFIAAGGNFIDTAHVYGDWVTGAERSASEKTIGRWLKARGFPADIVVATKIGHPKLSALNKPRLDRDALRSDTQAALNNLGVAKLDLVYLHRDDPSRPVGDIVAALEELRSDGVIGHYAASNWSAERLEKAQRLARTEHWQGFIANQPGWSLARRNPGTGDPGTVEMDAEAFAFHARTQLAAIPYSTQAKGYFTKLLAGRLGGEVKAAYDNSPNRVLGRRVGAVADGYHTTPEAAVLASLMAAPFPVIPIVGCMTPAQVAASFASLDLKLPHDVLQAFAGYLFADVGTPVPVPA